MPYWFWKSAGLGLGKKNFCCIFLFDFYISLPDTDNFSETLIYTRNTDNKHKLLGKTGYLIRSKKTQIIWFILRTKSYVKWGKNVGFDFFLLNEIFYPRVDMLFCSSFSSCLNSLEVIKSLLPVSVRFSLSCMLTSYTWEVKESHW